MQRIFLCYADEDSDSAHRLLVHLAPLQKSGQIEVWHKHRITAGAQWLDETKGAIDQSDVAVMLVTAEFLASPFCQDLQVEPILLRASEHGLIVIPIIVDYCDWREIDWLKRIKVLPRNEKPVSAQKPRSKAWTDVCRQVGRTLLASKVANRRVRVSDNLEHSQTLSSLNSVLNQLPRAGRSFLGRREELDQLTDCLTNPDYRGVSVIAFGGMGKSALLREWLETRAANRDQYRFVGCSFFSQGTQREANSEQFLTRSLQSLGDRNPARGTLDAKGKRLAERLCDSPTILVLDGIEPLQFGVGTNREGELRDNGIRALLAGMLEGSGESFFIITSRIKLIGESFRTSAFRQMELSLLPPDTARELLRSRGVKGSDQDLNRAAEYLGRHALAIALAAEYVYTFQNGEVRSVAEIPLVSDGIQEGRYAKSVMEAYVAALKRDGNFVDVELLKLLGLFDRPIRWEWLESVCSQPQIEGLTNHLAHCSNVERWESMSRLRQWNLIASEDVGLDAPLDAHPLIREYFGARLEDENPRAWRMAHERLFRSLVTDATPLPDTLEEMEPLLVGAAHGCKSGNYRETLNSVYLPRIMRGNVGYAVHDLEARESVLSLLINFFANRKWAAEIAPNPAADQSLTEQDQLTVLIHSGQILASARGYANPHSKACFIKSKELCSKDGTDAFVVAHGLWHCALAEGNLAKSEQDALKLEFLSRNLNNPLASSVACRVLSTQYFYMGSFQRALKHAKDNKLSFQATDIRAREFLIDPVATCKVYEGLALWHLGDLDAAVHACRLAINQAEQTSHPLTTAVVMYLASLVYANSRDVETTERQVREVIEICEVEGFTLWRSTSRIVLGWALTQQVGREEEGMRHMKQGLASWEVSGSHLFKAFWSTLIAEGLMKAGDPEQALRTIEDGLAACAAETRWCEPELHRLKALLLHQLEPNMNVEEHLNKALVLARESQSVTYELRAARELCRISRVKNGSSDACELLQNVYGRMISGHESVDMREARELFHGDNK